MGIVYKKALRFKKKYPSTVCWRLKKNAEIVERHLHSDEEVLYVFCGQENDSFLSLVGSTVVALTNKRLLIGRKRIPFGYFLKSITPDMFNDLKVSGGILWGKVYIDTVKEFVSLSHIDKAALREIETQITSFMMEEKKKYPSRDND